MDSYNLQGAEDQINGLGAQALDEQNFISNYNANQVESYKTNLNNLENKWGQADQRNLAEFGAYQLHMGDASKRLYDAVKGGFEIGDSQLAKNPVRAYEGAKYLAKLPGRLVTKAPVNDVFTGRQEVNTVDLAEQSNFEPNLVGDVYSKGNVLKEDSSLVDFYKSSATPNTVTADDPDEIGGLYKSKTPLQTKDGNSIETSQPKPQSENPVNEPTETTPEPVETNAGTTTEAGASTGTEVAGAVDKTAEATEGLTETTRMAKLGSALKGGFSTAGTVAEGVGKVAGTVASGVFLGLDIGQQVSSGKFFYGDDKAQNIGNTMNEIGSAMDVIGVATGDPLLVALGVGSSAVGGIISGFDELFEHKQKEKDPSTIDDKNLTPQQQIAGSVVDTNIAGAGGLAQQTTSTLAQARVGVA